MEDFFKAIVEGFVDPVVFVNNQHVIEYMNEQGAAKYAKRGGSGLVGRSIFDCHNGDSCHMIQEIYEDFLAGKKDEQYLTVGRDNKRVFMRVVRDSKGKVLGYYERYEENFPEETGLD